MRTYGQYCPVARTAEIVAERWTLIIIRNLLGGVTTFSGLRAGAPGIPKALLAERLASLMRVGIVVRQAGRNERDVHYELTQAGRDLQPLCDAMGAWGMRWLEVEPQQVEPAYVIWATARLVDVDRLPAGRIVVRVELTDRPDQRWWLLLHRPAAEVCARPPGADEDLVVRTDADALARWHLRQLTYRDLLLQKRISVQGASPMVRAFPTWIRPSPHAATGSAPS